MRESEIDDKALSLGIWARLAPYLKQVRKHLVAVSVFMLLSALANAAFPLFTSYAVNAFITPGRTAGLWLFCVVFLALIVFEGLTVLLFSRQSIAVEMYMGRQLKRDCFVRLQELPIAFYNVNAVGYLIARIMSDTDRISGMVAWGFSHAAWNLCYILGAVIFMVTLKPSLALLLLALVPVVVLITVYFQKKNVFVSRRIRAVNAQLTGAYNEGITGARVSKTLVIEEKNCRDFEAVTSEMYQQAVISARLTATMLPLVLFCGALAVGAVLYKGGILVMNDLLDYGILAAFISYAVSIIEPIMQVSSLLSDMVGAQVGIERVTALVDAPLTISDAPGVIEKYGDVFNPKRENWEPIIGEITFENVSFHYPDSDTYVLEDFCLHIPAGTTVAIVGETGAGKSTLVNLACRFYEPTRGRVLIDGRDVRERSQLWLHSALGYVLQDPHLFSGTMMENIRYGRIEATDDEVRKAAALVSADIVAGRLPDGYDTQVGEGGSRLSTGEKQLVSLARAVLADPPIFVLDEATSSIDTETEQLIQNAVAHILKGRTSFLIAHRLSTIRRADLILVVDDGKIVERGTHETLLAQNGRYAALCRAMRLEEDKFVGAPPDDR
ncbi:ABC transporter ATP-binding protein [Oscillospiraceae bacterium WX1]